MNFKAQASLEFLFVVIVVLILVVLIFANIPKDTNEISALGIAKNKIDEFVLKSNYSGNFDLNVVSNDTDLNLYVHFDSDYNNQMFQDYNKMIIKAVKKATNFEKIYIYKG